MHSDMYYGLRMHIVDSEYFVLRIFCFGKFHYLIFLRLTTFAIYAVLLY